MKYSVFVTSPRGLEEVTSKEISSLLNTEVKPDSGGVHLDASLDEIYKLNISLRTAMHVLQKVCTFNASNINEIYDQVASFDWSDIIGLDKTFSIRTRVNSRQIIKNNFLTLRIKDAIVDRIHKDRGRRPFINKENPDFPLFVFIRDKKVSIYKDTSGLPLYRRDYRGKVHRASLNPSMAAGLILLSGWDKVSPLYDPMCGSGTIAIEALMYALSIPPGIYRNEYAFKKWPDFNLKNFNSMKSSAFEIMNSSKVPKIFASDNTVKNLDLVKDSLNKINLRGKVKTEIIDIRDFTPKEEKGVIITNPPHGHRMGSEDSLRGLYRIMGDTLKKNCAGFDAYIFCMNSSLAKSIGLQATKKHVLKNGKLDCRLLHFPIKEGKFI